MVRCAVFTCTGTLVMTNSSEHVFIIAGNPGYEEKIAMSRQVKLLAALCGRFDALQQRFVCPVRGCLHHNLLNLPNDSSAVV